MFTWLYLYLQQMENKNYQTENEFSGHKNKFQNELLVFNPEQTSITEGHIRIWQGRTWEILFF